MITPKELIAENLKRKQKKNKEATESESERHSTTKIIDKEKAGKIIFYLKKIIDTESAQSMLIFDHGFNIQNLIYK
jgi:hypothetical protein